MEKTLFRCYVLREKNLDKSNDLFIFNEGMVKNKIMYSFDKNCNYNEISEL